MGIGLKLDKLLKEKGMNANELANAVGVSPTTIYSMINRDSRKADIDVLLKIAKLLNVTADYFCNNDSNPIPVSGYNNSTLTLSSIEEKVIVEYRKSDDYTKELVHRVLKIDKKGDSERMA